MPCGEMAHSMLGSARIGRYIVTADNAIFTENSLAEKIKNER
jgi:hypothetical protein